MVFTRQHIDSPKFFLHGNMMVKKRLSLFDTPEEKIVSLIDTLILKINPLTNTSTTKFFSLTDPLTGP
jgi:hypothetical protein